MKHCHIKEKFTDHEGTLHSTMWCGKRYMAERELEEENEKMAAEAPEVSEEEMKKIRAEIHHCQGCLKNKTKHHGVEYMKNLGFPLPNSMRKKK